MTSTITRARADAFCRDILHQLGVGEREAQVCSDVLVESSLRGVDSHGILSLPIYAERIRSGQMCPGVDLQIVRDRGATLFCDGGHGLGPVQALEAAALVVDKAAQAGVGVASISNCNYVGALAPYVERIGQSGMLGMCAANSTPRVAPHGGREGVHGTNPLSYAVPSADGQMLVFDAATGHSAARVTAARDEGLCVGDGVLVDAQGRPSNDPEALEGGALLPVGGALGYGLGLLVDLLCGGLSGGPCGRDVPPVEELSGPYGSSFFIMAIDGDFFGGREVLAERCAFLMHSVRQIAPALGTDRVRAPGERALQERQARIQRGIPLSAERWNAVLQRLRRCELAVEDWC